MKSHRNVLLAAVLIGCATPAIADPLEGQERESRILSDKWYVSVGWFGADISTDVAFGFGDFIGTSIRLEDELSLAENKDSTRLGFRYRFNRKHSIALGAFELNRTATTTIDEPIEIEGPDGDGLRFNLGATVDSEIDNKILGIFYNYSLYNNGKIDAGLNFGLSTYDFGLSLAGEAELIDEDGNPIGTTQARSGHSSVTAPVPVYGVFINYAIRKNVIFTFNSGALNLDVGDYEGRVADTRGSVEWFFTKHFGVGGGVTSTNVEVQKTGEDPFRVDYSYGGFLLFLSGAF